MTYKEVGLTIETLGLILEDIKAKHPEEVYAITKIEMKMQELGVYDKKFQ